MHLPGSEQVGFGKRFFQQFAWQDFRPHPEWAHSSECSLANSDWIWFPEGNPAVDAPAATRFFRRTIVLDPAKTVARARLRVSADDRFVAWVNGTKLGSGTDWANPGQFNDLAHVLKPGTNVLAVETQNMPAPSANPAGLIATLEIQFADGSATQIRSDGTWRSAQNESAGWNSTNFDDSTWTPAMVVARYGEGPWGQIDGQNNDAFGPQATGIPGVVRVIYSQRPDPVEVRELGPNSFYEASYFDPVTGMTTKLGEIRSDNNGLWSCPPPAGMDHDWVVVLELKKEHSSVLPRQMTLSNKQLAWHFDWSGGALRSTWFDNKLTGHRFVLSDVRELGLISPGPRTAWPSRSPAPRILKCATPAWWMTKTPCSNYVPARLPSA